MTKLQSWKLHTETQVPILAGNSQSPAGSHKKHPTHKIQKNQISDQTYIIVKHN